MTERRLPCTLPYTLPYTLPLGLPLGLPHTVPYRLPCGLLCVLLAGLLVLPPRSALRGEDWPTFGHDARRSQTTAEQLDFRSLELAWSWHSPQPPRPAWGQPAKGDAFADLRDLPSMRNYDPVFHPIVAGDAVYFGSNVDDSVRCLDLASGATRWTFTAGGPVRIAPTWSEGRVYFGSDDGLAYALRAESGQPLWQFRPPAAVHSRRVLHDGRLISFWPCRSGVLVDGPTAWFSCSLLPWRKSYLCAVDARTGRAEGSGRYVVELDAATLEGPLVAGGDLLFSPQGRESPLQFQRGDGSFLGALGQSGYGVFCVLTPDNRLLHGPRSRRGGLADSQAVSRAPVAVHRDARAMIVTGQRSYLLTDQQLVAGDVAHQKILWKQPVTDVAAMILAGDHLLLGGTDRVRALDAAQGETVWSAAVEGRAYGLVAANQSLLVSTDTGRLYCFRKPTTSAASTPAASPLHAPPPVTTVSEDPAGHPIPPLEDPDLLDRWVLSPRAARTAVDGSHTEFVNLAGGLPARLQGPVEWERGADHDAARLRGNRHQVLITDDLQRARLPVRAMTAEAWVRVDQPTEWGGILGAIQDNGNFERGWLLGYRQNKFSFALAGEEANGRLTYLTATADFEARHWHHVAATYDGQTMGLYVDGERVAASREQKGDIRYPPRAFYVLGAYQDDNERYPLDGALHEVRLYGRVLSDEQIRRHAKERSLTSDRFASPRVGPWLQFDSPRSAILRWQSVEPARSRVELNDPSGRRRVWEGAETNRHEVHLSELGRDRRYLVRIQQIRDGHTTRLRPFELDTYFNFQLGAPQPLEGVSASTIATESGGGAAVGETYGTARQLAERIAEHSPRAGGLCYVLGAAEGQLAAALAATGRVRVVGMDTDAGRVERWRRRAVERGVYGPWLSYLKLESPGRVPAPDYSANLLVVCLDPQGRLPLPADQLQRLVRPAGGTLVLLAPESDPPPTDRSRLDQLLESLQMSEARLDVGDGFVLAIASRGPLVGGGQWTHMYGDAANAAYTGEQLAGVRRTDQLEVAWFGRPGPRYQTDRQNRKSSPLFAGGRLYLQGQERIIALDGYNGLILWSLEIPDLLRFNIPRDAANWCCDDQRLFVALRDGCLEIDGATGQVLATHAPPPADGEPQSPASPPPAASAGKGSVGEEPAVPAAEHWGYVARSENLLVGSAVRPGSSFTEFWGKDYWFDQKSGVYTHQVCSERLFALHASSGTTAWQYAGGKIWNATITIGDGRIYFLESRHPDLRNQPSGRLGLPELYTQQYLVALELSSGRRLWERPIQTAAHVLLANMAHGDDTLVLQTSVNHRFPIRTFDPATGEPRWETGIAWPRADHGGHLSRPAIIEGRLFVRPAVLDLKTGKLLASNLPGGGCGTYVGSREALFFRSGSGGMLSAWDPDAGSYTHWPRLRPDCWLSTIPAGGMLLSPEGGGGCSCGKWMEMSVGFLPIR